MDDTQKKRLEEIKNTGNNYNLFYRDELDKLEPDVCPAYEESKCCIGGYCHQLSNCGPCTCNGDVSQCNRQK